MKEKANKNHPEIAKRLARAIPHPEVELDFDNPWQLVIATILSAQSTDKTINRLTPELFAQYPNPAALAAASQEEVETLIKASGFFRNKAKAIRGASQVILERFGGEVPKTMEEMLEIPGVARKTANVVLGSAYGIASGIVVDTHVGRVSRRLELTKHEDPVRVEKDLQEILPRKDWITGGMRILLHGRYVCTAKAPACGYCPLNEICPSQEGPPIAKWTVRADAERRTVESRGQTPFVID